MAVRISPPWRSSCSVDGSGPRGDTLSSDECRTAALSDTAEILCRWLPKRLLEHGDEGRDGFITEIGRNPLHACAGGQLSHCDDQMQLLAPAPKGQPRLLHHETCQTALAERDAIGPFR